jgi:ribosomal protein S12 methylthiotransferase accessory factor
MLPFERERTLSNAYESMRAHIAERGWFADFTMFGDDVVTTQCVLRHADESVVAGGYGKGNEDISRVGAMYEAMEHYYGLIENVDIEVVCVRADEIHAEARFASLPFVTEFVDQKERRLACAVYKDLHSGASVRIPLFLVFPQYASSARIDGDDFDYSVVLRYASNSGTAIGATFEEAAVHALNEIVERDAWSLFLLSHFMGAPHKIGRLIDSDTVPDKLKQLLVVASQRASDRGITLVDITSDIGIPTFLATVDSILPTEQFYPSGFGTSTYPFYAAYRAVTELIQVIDLKKQSGKSQAADRMTLEMVSGYKKMRDCTYFEVDTRRLEHGLWDYEEQPREGLSKLLSDIVFRLHAHGIDVCFNVNHLVADTFCVVSCVSMTLERFFLVSAGHLMAPGARGMKLFARGRESEPATAAGECLESASVELQ